MNNWQPSASLPTLKARALLIESIRIFFKQRDVLEVQTPIINHAGVTDVNIDSFGLFNDLGYLRTSPEYFHKRLLAAGYGDIYEIGPVFRVGENSHRHNPEFTMLEWYRLDWSYHQLAEEVIQLLQFCSPNKLAKWSVKTYQYADLFQQHIGLNFIQSDDKSLQEIAIKNGLMTVNDRPTLLDFLFSHLVQPALPDKQISIIVDYPAEQAALATIDPQRPQHCQRFEVFLGQTELTNGYQELTNADVLEQRFIRDNEIRQQQKKPQMMIDEKLLAAMRAGLPQCAGVALGVDRLLQVILEKENIHETIGFSS